MVFTERVGSLQTTHKGVHFTTDRVLYSELLMTDFSVCLREFDCCNFENTLFPVCLDGGFSKTVKYYNETCCAVFFPFSFPSNIQV